jgi:hypothetical protein
VFIPTSDDSINKIPTRSDWISFINITDYVTNMQVVDRDTCVIGQPNCGCTIPLTDNMVHKLSLLNPNLQLMTETLLIEKIPKIRYELPYTFDMLGTDRLLLDSSKTIPLYFKFVNALAGCVQYWHAVQKQAIFIQVPKNASTSISKYIFESTYSDYPFHAHRDVNFFNRGNRLSTAPVVAVIRDPVDRVLSWINWFNQCRGKNDMTLDTFLKGIDSKKRFIYKQQHEWISGINHPHQELKLVRFEQVDKIQSILTDVGLSTSSQLVHVNNSKKTVIQIGAHHRLKIDKVFSKDIELYNGIPVL